ncbi:hypothetical protein [Pseudomonas sp. ATCC 13867]|nr:hypothetical protein [Pseudomonas sp. ATCC 13867]
MKRAIEQETLRALVETGAAWEIRVPPKTSLILMLADQKIN